MRINDPYRGAELVRRYSDPAAGRHSIQIEINRRLYLDEDRVEKTGGFDRLRDHVSALIEHLCGFVSRRLPSGQETETV